MPIRRYFRGLTDIVLETAPRKAHAAQARTWEPASRETPRVVYQASCDRIGGELSGLGFRYARSAHQARRPAVRSSTVCPCHQP